MRKPRAFAAIPLLRAGGLGVLLLHAGCARDPGANDGNSPVGPALAGAPSGAHSQSALAVVGQWCTWLNAGVDPNDLAVEYGLQVTKVFPDADMAVLVGTVDRAVLAADPRVKLLQANELTFLSQPVDLTMGFNQGDLDEATTATQPALASLDLSTTHRWVTGRGVRVAVLDTGVDPTHPHLASRVEMPPAGSPLCGLETANGVDDDLDGRVDEAYGHGTHVAGIIATVAPNATILPIKVLNDDGVGDVFDLAEGLYLAYERGANVVNLSLVLTGESVGIEYAIRLLKYWGIVVVGAAGNVPGAPFFPASDPDVMSVAATGPGDVLAPFSASGAVRVAAPGVAVESSFPGNRKAVGTGTSMACAVVSGCVALLAEHANVDGQPRPVAGAVLLRRFAVPMLPLGTVDDGRVAPLQALGFMGWPLPRGGIAVPTGDGG
jgi:subtilisin family serine protease